MYTIVDKIRLKPGTDPGHFESWLTARDYPSCGRLRSIVRFSVVRCSTEAEALFHYFEVIEVDSLEAFEADMMTDTFRGLVAEFSEMAQVVETSKGENSGSGYHRVQG